MSWKRLLQEHKVHHHQTSVQEIAELQRLIVRDLADASIPALSEDRRFATAYAAALNQQRSQLPAASSIRPKAWVRKRTTAVRHTYAQFAYGYALCVEVTWSVAACNYSDQSRRRGTPCRFDENGITSEPA